MSERIDATYENGVFRPVVPVNMANGQRVSLNVESQPAALDDLGDIADLLDLEFVAACRQSTRQAPTVEEVRRILSVFSGSLADRIIEERDER